MAAKPKLWRLSDHHVCVRCPFDARFVSSAHRLGGRWDHRIRAWVFEARLTEDVRALLHTIFNTEA